MSEKAMKRTFWIAFIMGIWGLGFLTAPVRGYDDMFGSPPDTFGGPRAGEKAPDFRLETLDGRTADLQASLNKGPVVLEFGSYTCPIFREKHPVMERLREKYGNRVSFFTVYTLEAHPKGDVCPYTGREWVTEPNEQMKILYRQPQQVSERKQIAKDAQSALGMRTTLVLDDMTNSTWEAYGGAPNAAYLIGADGTVTLRQGWFEPEDFENALKRELSP